MDALGTALDMVFQSCLLQFGVDRPNKTFDIGIAVLFGGTELFLDHVIGIMLQIFQAEVFQLAFQLIETQFVGQGGIQIAGLLAHLHLGLHPVGISYLPHQVHPVGNHDEYHAHVFGKREEQVAEVLALHDGIFLVKLLYALQTVDDACHVLAEILCHIIGSLAIAGQTGIEQDGHHAIAFQSDFVHSNLGSLQTEQQGVHAKHVTLHHLATHGMSQIFEHLAFIIFVQQMSYLAMQRAYGIISVFSLFVCKKKFFAHFVYLIIQVQTYTKFAKKSTVGCIFCNILPCF